jgi:thiamine-phosphate diphosphorylase
MIFERPRPVLMAIFGAGGAEAAARASAGGADLIQVRAKSLESKDLLALVQDVVKGVGDPSKVIVNSRPDIAELAGAGGVHLPEAGLDPVAVRRAFPKLLIGVSAHNRAGLDRAADAGADYAILGPVFETPGKERDAIGLERWRDMIFDLALPVVAVGGLAPRNLASLIEAGARGIAGIRPFADPEQAATSAALFRAALDRARAPAFSHRGQG